MFLTFSSISVRLPWWKLFLDNYLSLILYSITFKRKPLINDKHGWLKSFVAMFIKYPCYNFEANMGKGILLLLNYTQCTTSISYIYILLYLQLSIINLWLLVIYDLLSICYYQLSYTYLCIKCTSFNFCKKY